MHNILVCINDGLLKLRINRILIDKNYAFQITGRPIKKTDLINYDFVIVHTSYRLPNLHNFIENVVIQKLSTIIYLSSVPGGSPFNKFADHPNFIYINESKMDVELPLSISLSKKYNLQMNNLSKENSELSKKIEENKIMSKCKRVLIKRGFSEDEAHKHILKYAMDNQIDRKEACNRLLERNSE